MARAHHFSCFFSKSRISVSSCTSSLGFAGSAGAGTSCFLRWSLEMRRMKTKMEKAMMMKSNVACRKLP